MSDLARLLQQYGYGEQPNALAQDGVTYDTSNVLAGMPRPNPLSAALRTAMNAIPENKELPPPQFFMDPRSLSMANMVRGGLDTAASWLDYQNKPQPSDYKASDVMGPLGAGFMGSMFAPKNALGIFGGRLAKTADHNALAKAEEMAAKGADRKDIWDQTGWFQGADGKWRFEIDDSKAWWNKPTEEGFVLDNKPIEGSAAFVFRHPDLFRAYPEAGKTQVGIERSVLNPREFQGWYDGERIGGKAGTTGDARDMMVHELQHVVQGREGFAKGAAPDTYTQQADATLARDALAWRRELERMPRGMDRSAKENAVIQQYRELGAMDWVPSREARDLALDTYGNPTAQLDEIVRFYGLDQKTSPYTPKQMYERTAGEVEARNAQKRAKMTEDERKAKPPWETEDTPPPRQLVR